MNRLLTLVLVAFAFAITSISSFTASANDAAPAAVDATDKAMTEGTTAEKKEGKRHRGIHHAKTTEEAKTIGSSGGKKKHHAKKHHKKAGDAATAAPAAGTAEPAAK